MEKVVRKTKFQTDMLLPAIITTIISLLSLPLMISCIYPENCGNHYNCAANQICKENQCICDIQVGFHHDDKRNKCVKLAGSQCRNGMEEGEEVYDCVENGHCNPKSKTCECDESYVETKFEECKKSHGTSCNKSEECNASGFLVCDKVIKVCRCQDPLQEVYDGLRKTCVSILSGKCEFETWMNMRKDCIKNSHCVRTEHEDSDYFGICKCKTGFTNISATLCLKLYQDDCDEHSDCITGFCSNTGKCDCTSASVISPNSQTCLVRVGGICSQNHSFLDCVTNSTCNYDTNRCQCMDDFTMKNGLCEPSVEPRSTISRLSAADASNSIFKVSNKILAILASVFLLTESYTVLF